jgi:hypothetical protein
MLSSLSFLRHHIFERRHFGETAAMSLCAAESRGEKCLNQFPGEGVTNHEATKTDQVQIVVLDTLMRRKVFVNQAGSNPRHFVRADGCSNPASTDAHAAIHLSAGDCTGQRNDKIRVVIAQIRPSVAEVDYFMPSLTQHPDQISL